MMNSSEFIPSRVTPQTIVKAHLTSTDQKVKIIEDTEESSNKMRSLSLGEAFDQLLYESVQIQLLCIRSIVLCCSLVRESIELITPP